ncbi:hypothetical protein M5689_003265 [Euphorbia peplus]|nr:hypothetical protein M5689_003265 [Euphorbia peplus]
MATEADIGEVILLKDKCLTTGKLYQPPESVDYLVKSADMEVACNVQVEIVNKSFDGNAGLTAGERFSESPSIAKLPDNNTNTKQETCQPKEISYQAEKTMPEETRIKEERSFEATEVKETTEHEVVDEIGHETSDNTGSLKVETIEQPYLDVSDEEILKVESDKQASVEENQMNIEKKTSTPQEDEGRKDDNDVELKASNGATMLEASKVLNEDSVLTTVDNSDTCIETATHASLKNEHADSPSCAETVGVEEMNTERISEDKLVGPSATLEADRSRMQEETSNTNDIVSSLDQTRVETSSDTQTKQSSLHEEEKMEISKMPEDYVKGDPQETMLEALVIKPEADSYGDEKVMDEAIAEVKLYSFVKHENGGDKNILENGDEDVDAVVAGEENISQVQNNQDELGKEKNLSSMEQNQKIETAETEFHKKFSSETHSVGQENVLVESKELGRDSNSEPQGQLHEASGDRHHENKNENDYKSCESTENTANMVVTTGQNSETSEYEIEKLENVHESRSQDQSELKDGEISIKEDKHEEEEECETEKHKSQITDDDIAKCHNGSLYEADTAMKDDEEGDEKTSATNDEVTDIEKVTDEKIILANVIEGTRTACLSLKADEEAPVTNFNGDENNIDNTSNREILLESETAEPVGSIGNEAKRSNEETPDSILQSSSVQEQEILHSENESISEDSLAKEISMTNDTENHNNQPEAETGEHEEMSKGVECLDQIMQKNEDNENSERILNIVQERVDLAQDDKSEADTTKEENITNGSYSAVDEDPVIFQKDERYIGQSNTESSQSRKLDEKVEIAEGETPFKKINELNATHLLENEPGESSNFETQDQVHGENGGDEEENDETDSQACKGTENTNPQHLSAKEAENTKASEEETEKLGKVYASEYKEEVENKDVQMSIEEKIGNEGKSCDEDIQKLETSDNTENFRTEVLNHEKIEQNFEAEEISTTSGGEENSRQTIGVIDKEMTAADETTDDENVKENVIRLSSEIANEQTAESSQQDEKEGDMPAAENTEGKIILQKSIQEEPLKNLQSYGTNDDKLSSRQKFEESETAETVASIADEAEQTDTSLNSTPQSSLVTGHESSQSENQTRCDGLPAEEIAVDGSSITEAKGKENYNELSEGREHSKELLKGEEDAEQTLSNDDPQHPLHVISLETKAEAASEIDNITVKETAEIPKENEERDAGTEKEVGANESNSKYLQLESVAQTSARDFQNDKRIEKSYTEILEESEVVERGEDIIMHEANKTDETPNETLPSSLAEEEESVMFEDKGVPEETSLVEKKEEGSSIMLLEEDNKDFHKQTSEPVHVTLEINQNEESLNSSVPSSAGMETEQNLQEEPQEKVEHPLNNMEETVAKTAKHQDDEGDAKTAKHQDGASESNTTRLPPDHVAQDSVKSFKYHSDVAEKSYTEILELPEVAESIEKITHEIDRNDSPDTITPETLAEDKASLQYQDKDIAVEASAEEKKEELSSFKRGEDNNGSIHVIEENNVEGDHDTSKTDDCSVDDTIQNEESLNSSTQVSELREEVTLGSDNRTPAEAFTKKDEDKENYTAQIEVGEHNKEDAEEILQKVAQDPIDHFKNDRDGTDTSNKKILEQCKAEQSVETNPAAPAEDVESMQFEDKEIAIEVSTEEKKEEPSSIKTSEDSHDDMIEENNKEGDQETCKTGGYSSHEMLQKEENDGPVEKTGAEFQENNKNTEIPDDEEEDHDTMEHIMDECNMKSISKEPVNQGKTNEIQNDEDNDKISNKEILEESLKGDVGDSIALETIQNYETTNTSAPVKQGESLHDESENISLEEHSLEANEDDESLANASCNVELSEATKQSEAERSHGEENMEPKLQNGPEGFLDSLSDVITQVSDIEILDKNVDEISIAEDLRTVQSNQKTEEEETKGNEDNDGNKLNDVSASEDIKLTAETFYANEADIETSKAHVSDYSEKNGEHMNENYEKEINEENITKFQGDNTDCMNEDAEKRIIMEEQLSRDISPQLHGEETDLIQENKEDIAQKEMHEIIRAAGENSNTEEEIMLEGREVEEILEVPLRGIDAEGLPEKDKDEPFMSGVIKEKSIEEVEVEDRKQLESSGPHNQEEGLERVETTITPLDCTNINATPDEAPYMVENKDHEIQTEVGRAEDLKFEIQDKALTEGGNNCNETVALAILSEKISDHNLKEDSLFPSNDSELMNGEENNEDKIKTAEEIRELAIEGIEKVRANEEADSYNSRNLNQDLELRNEQYQVDQQEMCKSENSKHDESSNVGDDESSGVTENINQVVVTTETESSGVQAEENLESAEPSMKIDHTSERLPSNQSSETLPKTDAGQQDSMVFEGNSSNLQSQLPTDDQETIELENVLSENAAVDDIEESKKTSDVYATENHDAKELHTGEVREEIKEAAETVLNPQAVEKHTEMTKDKPAENSSAMNMVEDRSLQIQVLDISQLDVQVKKGSPDSLTEEHNEIGGTLCYSKEESELASGTMSQSKINEVADDETLHRETSDEQYQTEPCVLLSNEMEFGCSTQIQKLEEAMKGEELRGGEPRKSEEACFQKEESCEFQVSEPEFEAKNDAEESLNESKMEVNVTSTEIDNKKEASESKLDSNSEDNEVAKEEVVEEISPVQSNYTDKSDEENSMAPDPLLSKEHEGEASKITVSIEEKTKETQSLEYEAGVQDAFLEKEEPVELKVPDGQENLKETNEKADEAINGVKDESEEVSKSIFKFSSQDCTAATEDKTQVTNEQMMEDEKSSHAITVGEESHEEHQQETLGAQIYEKLIRNEESSSVEKASESTNKDLTMEKEVVEEQKAKSDEEEKIKSESESDSPVMVETQVKIAEKKSHNNILAGVGSKVKHSIIKVKKAIIGGDKSSSHTKQHHKNHGCFAP